LDTDPSAQLNSVLLAEPFSRDRSWRSCRGVLFNL